MRKLAGRVAYVDAYEEAMRKLAAGDFANPENMGPSVGVGQDQFVAKQNKLFGRELLPSNVSPNLPSNVGESVANGAGEAAGNVAKGAGEAAGNVAKGVEGAAEGAAEGVSKKPGLFRRALGSKVGKVGLGLAAAGALAYGASKLFGGGRQEEPEEQWQMGPAQMEPAQMEPAQMEPAQPDEYMNRMHEQQMQGRQVMRQRPVPPHMHQQMEEMQDQLAPQYMEG